MRAICVFGAGALGGALAARLAAAPELSHVSVSVVARGPHLAAIQQNGLHLQEDGKSLAAHVRATDNSAELGPQDLVFTALKGHQLPAAADALAPLLGPSTRVVTIQNGIPWWYFHGDTGSKHQGAPIPLLDPHNALRDRVGPDRIIGCIAYQGAEVTAPGRILITPNGRIILGEPASALTPDLAAVAGIVAAAGWRVDQTQRIREEIWRKLMGNAAFNPISALTGATLAGMIDEQDVASVARTVMNEVRAVAAALGVPIETTPEQRMALSRPMGEIKTSMLQDLERGRSMEIIPLLGAPSYLGQLAGVPTPAIDMIYALVSCLERSRH